MRFQFSSTDNISPWWSQARMSSSLTCSCNFTSSCFRMSIFSFFGRAGACLRFGGEGEQFKQLSSAPDGDRTSSLSLSWHGLCVHCGHHVTLPSDNILQHVLRSGVHPSCLVLVGLLKESVGDDKFVLNASLQQQCAIRVISTNWPLIPCFSPNSLYDHWYCASHQAHYMTTDTVLLAMLTTWPLILCFSPNSLYDHWYRASHHAHYMTSDTVLFKLTRWYKCYCMYKFTVIIFYNILKILLLGYSQLQFFALTRTLTKQSLTRWAQLANRPRVIG